MSDDFHAPGDVPNAFIVVRGGKGNLPPAGTCFSGAFGATIEEAARGVPHGTIPVAAAPEIRSRGGMILVRPERSRGGTMNGQHVDIVEGPGRTAFGPPIPNPVPKELRIG